MKTRSHALLIALLGVMPLAAQDQTPSTNAPLQIQDQPVPGTTPAPSLFGTNQDAAPSAPAADSNAVAAPSPADTNAPASDASTGSPGQNPPPSDPNALIPPPVAPEQPSPINASGNEEKQRMEQKTRYYTAKTQADKEEALADLLAKADKAKSDESKRQTLREYYDLLAKRMKKIDPSISEWIDTMHSAYLRRLEQVRVEPTIPLTAPPAPAADSAPTPSGKHKKANADQAESGSIKKGESTPAHSPSPSSRDKKGDKPSPTPEKKKSKSTPTPSPSPSSKDKKKGDKPSLTPEKKSV